MRRPRHCPVRRQWRVARARRHRPEIRAGASARRESGPGRVSPLHLRRTWPRGLRGLGRDDGRGLRGAPFAFSLERRQRRGSSPCATARRSFSMRAMTSAQSSPFFWRNSRMVGYQGLSSRSSSQRQSVTHGSSTQTGLPSAPARWAVERIDGDHEIERFDGAAPDSRNPESAGEIVDRRIAALEFFEIGSARPNCKLTNDCRDGKQRRKCERSSERR